MDRQTDRKTYTTQHAIVSLLKYRRPHKTSFHPIIKSPTEKFLPADNLPVKIRPARAAAGRGGFLPVNRRPEGEFSGGGDPIMGHRPNVCCGTWRVGATVVS